LREDSCANAAPVAMAGMCSFQVAEMSRKANKRKRQGRKGRQVPAGKPRTVSKGFAARVAGLWRSFLALFGGRRRDLHGRPGAGQREEADGVIDGAAIAASASAAANMAAIAIDASAIAADAAATATKARSQPRPQPKNG
jgi:hypothetical protein